MDWTDLDGDAQTTIVLSVITNHGRATPLLWKTVAVWRALRERGTVGAVG